MTKLQINPLLIQLLSGQESSITSDFFTTSSLPGKYVDAIFQHKQSLIPPIEENYHMLTCKSCGRRGKYDVGMIVVNVDKENKEENMIDNIQTTGYFRCKHCHDAGNWEFPSSFLTQAMASVLQFGNSIIGKNLLFDGSWHRFATDAEEHLLHLLKQNPQDAYIWNRLGNLYHKGNRPELAVSAFEHSIKIDPSQIESHYTLGDLLAQISDLQNAGYHLRQMLLGAAAYKKMPAVKLREMLASGLQLLFFMSDHTNGEVPFLPTLDEIKESEREVSFTNLTDVEVDIFPDDISSFFPIAEMYMGIRAKEIPIRERTFKLTNTSKKVKGKKKKRKKRK